jgi:hypothetical protein
VKRTYIVTDTSPLITLALAGELDLLLRLGTPVTWSRWALTHSTIALAPPAVRTRVASLKTASRRRKWGSISSAG